MITNRVPSIADIIKKRLPLARRITDAQENLRALSHAFYQLEEKRMELVQVADEDVKARLMDLDFLGIQSKISAILEPMDKLRIRFSRNTLNIGVIGRARQGKSTLLQSVSGLSSSEIPTGDFQHCTGVRSVIHHTSGVEPYGEVSFYSEKSFLNEVLLPYYDDLKLSPRPYSLDDFANNPLPILYELSGSAKSMAQYEHLLRYKKHITVYRPLLHGDSPIRIPITRIREYVAQDTIDGKRDYNNYLAVREARIVCSFPHDDIGQVALIDMPGLGDTGIGDQERMIATLGQDVDIVIIVKKPEHQGAFWSIEDVDLYDLARSALKELPIDKWVFIVLNNTQINEKNCNDLANSIVEKHIDTVGTLIADCSDPNDVNRIILDRVLDYLSNSIATLDEMYVSSTQDRLLHLHNSVSTVLAKTRQSLDLVVFRNDEINIFNMLFDDIWAKLKNQLVIIVRQFRQDRNQESDILKEAIESVITECVREPGIPTIEEIEFMRNQENSYQNACNKYLDKIRSRMTKRFLILDICLQRFIDDVKNRVANVFIEDGRLCALNGTYGVSFLSELVNIIPTECEQLRFGFKMLASFKLSFRGFIQYRLRQHLDRLVPDDAIKYIEWSDQPSAEEVQWWLTKLYKETVNNIREAFKYWLNDPSQVAFSVVEEFVDCVVNTEGVDKEWRAFYTEVRSEIWPEEFTGLVAKGRLIRQWKSAIDDANFKNNLKYISILD